MSSDIIGRLGLPLPCIDSITALDASGTAAAVRAVDPAEPFFIDHFPEFPVLPGVLQLEGMVQTASWWLRWKDDFRHAVCFMTGCSPAKFSKLVRPDMRIEFEVQHTKLADGEYAFKGKIVCADQGMSQARFKIRLMNIRDIDPKYEHLEDSINSKNREIFESLSSQALIKQ